MSGTSQLPVDRDNGNGRFEAAIRENSSEPNKFKIVIKQRSGGGGAGTAAAAGTEPGAGGEGDGANGLSPSSGAPDSLPSRKPRAGSRNVNYRQQSVDEFDGVIEPSPPSSRPQSPAPGQTAQAQAQAQAQPQPPPKRRPGRPKNSPPPGSTTSTGSTHSSRQSSGSGSNLSNSANSGSIRPNGHSANTTASHSGSSTGTGTGTASPSLWTEPEIASQKLYSTGLPLESFPPGTTATNKRRPGRPPNSARGLPDSAASATAAQPADTRSASPISPPPDAPESKLKANLKTELYQEIAKESSLREGQAKRGRPPKRKSLGPQGKDGSKRSRKSTGTAAADTPPPVRDQFAETLDERQHRSAHVKVSSGRHPRYNGASGANASSAGPAANASGAGAATTGAKDASGSDTTEAAAGPQREPNEDFCSVCGGAGRFLCCETCPRSFHFSCVDPPLDEDSLPDGEWNCRKCYTERHPPVPYRKGLFSQLLNQVEKRNPTRFELPKGIQDYFEGVTSNPSGEYETQLRPVKRGNNVASDDDPLKTLDNYGNPILCYRCKKSALSGVQMLTCDFCSLYFHVDCVEPMVLSVGTRWICPNHVGQAYKGQRKPRKYRIEDASLRRGFANDGDIEVVLTEDELSEQFEKRVPRFFHDSYNTPDGVAAKKLAPQGTYSRSFEIDGVKYRLPEEGIKLDFLDFVHQNNQQRQQQTEYKTTESNGHAAQFTDVAANDASLLVALDALADRPQPDRKAVRDLMYLQSNGSADETNAQATSNLSRLLDAALLSNANDDEDFEQQTKKAIVGDKERYFATEAVQLLAIRELMQMKGKEKLMKFLSS